MLINGAFIPIYVFPDWLQQRRTASIFALLADQLASVPCAAAGRGAAAAAASS
jgi:hypothetical protein